MVVIGDPTISEADAADVCAQPWPSREEAIAQAMILRRAGWWVPIWDGHRARYDGTVVAATVYHPGTWESPGDVTWMIGGQPDGQ